MSPEAHVGTSTPNLFQRGEEVLLPALAGQTGGVKDTAMRRPDESLRHLQVHPSRIRAAAARRGRSAHLWVGGQVTNHKALLGKPGGLLRG